MGLEDELSLARRMAEAHDRQKRDARQQKAAADAELRSVLAEAVQRLQRFPGKRLRRYEVSKSRFGADRSVIDSAGQRWRRVSDQRCWIVVERFGAGKRPRHVLLVEDGTMGGLSEENSLTCSEPDVFALRDKLQSIRQDSDFREHIPTGPSSFETGEFDVRAVKRKLAAAIVAHERRR